MSTTGELSWQHQYANWIHRLIIIIYINTEASLAFLSYFFPYSKKLPPIWYVVFIIITSTLLVFNFCNFLAKFSNYAMYLLFHLVHYRVNLFSCDFCTLYFCKPQSMGCDSKAVIKLSTSDGDQFLFVRPLLRLINL